MLQNDGRAVNIWLICAGGRCYSVRCVARRRWGATHAAVETPSEASGSAEMQGVHHLAQNDEILFGCVLP